MKYLLARWGCVLIFIIFLVLGLACVTGIIFYAWKGAIISGAMSSLGASICAWMCIRVFDGFYISKNRPLKYINKM